MTCGMMISSSTFAVQRLGSVIGTALGVDDQALDDPVEAADDDADDREQVRPLGS